MPTVLSCTSPKSVDDGDGIGSLVSGVADTQPAVPFFVSTTCDKNLGATSQRGFIVLTTASPPKLLSRRDTTAWLEVATLAGCWTGWLADGEVTGLELSADTGRDGGGSCWPRPGCRGVLDTGWGGWVAGACGV